MMVVRIIGHVGRLKNCAVQQKYSTQQINEGNGGMIHDWLFLEKYSFEICSHVASEVSCWEMQLNLVAEM